MGRIIHVNTIIAHHLIFMGYGHWVANDPRGSGSTEVRAPKLEDLGPIHLGRKKLQPSRQELREFYQEARDRLEHETVWFDQQMRRVVADAFGEVVKQCGYTAWAGAILQNHGHQVVRVHRDDGHLIWERMALASRDALRAGGLVPAEHPVWSTRPYVVFKKTVGSVRNAIGYVEDNFTKHGLPKEIYPWITPYDGFPFHRKNR